MKILQNVRVENILLNVFDKRLTKVADLTVVQLKEECLNRNLSNKGKKVSDNITPYYTFIVLQYI